MKAYRMDRIINPFDSEPTKKEKGIYQFSEYKSLYEYVKDIEKHKDKAILEAFKQINGDRDFVCYDSAWLYVLLHINNAWRNSDIVQFPRINLDITEIKDLYWLQENEISVLDARRIVNQITRKDLVISKTQARNAFFCSEDLLIPFATAASICELRTQALNPHNAGIIDFNIKAHKMSDSAYKSFFNGYTEGFIFRNRKMNRSLMTYVYLILAKNKSGELPLTVTQYMRGHKDPESTNIYVTVPESELQFLTRQLFNRGYFGHITELFAQLLMGKNEQREVRTEELVAIKERFGDIYKIEATAGFLSDFQKRRASVVDAIRAMSIDEVSKYMHQITTEQLPSKQDNVQCLVSKTGCVKKGEGIDCASMCHYSIPNFYALSALGRSLQENVNKFRYEFEEAEYPAEKTKLANIIFMELRLFYEAADKFGEEVVFDFISDSKQIFESKLEKLPSIIDITTV